MTQEDKELLLIDLCARWPYGVKCHIDFTDESVSPQIIVGFNKDYLTLYDEDAEMCEDYPICEIKPYLRPMSSMTKEEYRKWHYLYLPFPRKNEATETERRIDWLNAHHFDYRNLIDKGLALEAPKDMYK